MDLGNSDKIIREKFEVSLLKDQSLLVVRLYDDETLNIADIRDMIAIHQEIAPNRKHLKRIIQSGKYSTIDADARKLLEEVEIPVNAEAYVLHSLAQRILFNMFIKFRSTNHPVKAFTDNDTALKWLNSLNSA